MSEMYDEITDWLDGGVWFWKRDLGWWWTHGEFYPYAWVHSDKSWAYFDIGRSTIKTNWLYSFQAKNGLVILTIKLNNFAKVLVIINKALKTNGSVTILKLT